MRRSLVFALIFPMCAAFAQQPGTLDTTFSHDGLLELPLSLLGSYAMGQTVTLAHIDDDLSQHFVTFSDTLIRFFSINESGSLDSTSVESFEPSGLAALSQYGYIQIEAIFPIDGLVYAILQSDSGQHMLRFDTDQEIDMSLGEGSGVQDLPWVRFNEQKYSGLRRLRGGGYLLWGSYRSLPPNQVQRNCYLMLLDEHMGPDSSFASNGSLVFMGSTMSNNPYPTVVDVGELLDGTIVVGLYYNTYGPAVFGSSSYRRISRSGVVLENKQIGCYSFSPGFNAFHVTCQDVMMYSVAYCTLAQLMSDTLYQSYSLGYTPHLITSDDHGRIYTVSQGCLIARRHPSGEFDDQFGEFVQGDGCTYSAQIPSNFGYLKGVKVLPDGKLLSWGYRSIPFRLIFTRHHNIPDPRSTLSLRMFLGGAYRASIGLMRDNLRQQGLLPNLQPYAIPFFPPANGVGAWAMPQHLLAVEGEEAVVDWVFLELISAADSSTVAATRVGILHRNGWVTSADGHSPIDFSAGAGSYFLRVRHRNHLGVTTSQPITLGPSTTTVDLTDPATPTFGTDAQMEVNGVRMLWPGDANTDGAVKYFGPYNDRDKILVAIGGSVPTATVTGYRAEDVNLDGTVKYSGPANDRDIILQTIGGTVPTAVRVEQRP